MLGARRRTSGDEAVLGGAEHGERVADGGGGIAQDQHEAGQKALHDGGGVGSVALARMGGMGGLGGSGSAHQGADVVCVRTLAAHR